MPALSSQYICAARPNWWRLLAHWVRCAAALLAASVGRSSDARMAMMAIVTRSSIRVKADCGLRIAERAAVDFRVGPAVPSGPLVSHSAFADSKATVAAR